MPSLERRTALRRMKLVAGGLLVFGAVVYALCLWLGDGTGAWGYLQAAAEASMVGGLADWFAVTALFRHPLGIPVPHTAIIPRKKDQIGESLAAFVEQNFLTATVVGQRLEAARVPQRIGAWLADPLHAERVADEASSILAAVAGMLRDDEIESAVAGFVDAQVRKVDVAPALARIIDAIRDEGQHQEALTAALRSLMRFMDLNRSVFRDRLSQESPEWVPDWVDDRVFERLFRGLQSFLADVIGNESHELRRQFDRYLGDYAQSLRTDPERAAAVNATKLQLLEHPEVRRWLGTLWLRLKASILNDVGDPDSELRRNLVSLTRRGGEALRDDAALQQRVDTGIGTATEYVLSHYSADIAELISGTVARWDAEETGRRLELQVGRDLQFIRINGTVVGALVGVLIHLASQLS
ncbi:Uncharacterized membrane-anchored protein YjiN, DUF445 family [Frankineae bacterium MT45]|nr:Uncharacterized membrane-anchored protein YjiN, DUF445 family [Frankineae bacterium MT45]